MRICCCIKRVPAPGARINVTADGLDVDSAHLGFTTSPHEECAVECAVQLVERNGGEVTVLTLGLVDAVEQLRYAVSVGASKAVLVNADSNAWDPQRTAAALAAAIAELEATQGRFDLMLFGNESADAGGFQVGVRVAHALGRPMVQGIKDIELHDDETTGRVVTARREIDGGFEVYELCCPCVLGVMEGLNLPRYPTMKGRLSSKKVEISEISANADPGVQKRVRLHRPSEMVTETVILGTGPEAAPAVVDVLEELGVL